VSVGNRGAGESGDVLVLVEVEGHRNLHWDRDRLLWTIVTGSANR